ncbi:MAG TPA: protease pro-enzyme activation domain-containing protein [Candidatus Baltobacteraceae bacterium]|nr:protease pro-enzyme activation domain-containing protein [Candidatus Baltobacteraceae bacterium]
MIRFASLRAVGGLCTLAVAFAACGGGASSPSVPGVTGAYDPGAIPQQLQIKDWGQSLMQGADYVGPVSNAHLTVNVLVHQQNASALLQYARDVNDPASPNFRKWLTPQQIGQRFGASPADYQKTADYFTKQGLSVGGWPQHMLLAVSGDQTAMQRAFNTTFALYRRNGVSFIAPSTTPHFSAAVPVDAVGRLVAYSRMHSYIMNPPRVGSGYALGYSPQQVRAAFDYNGAYLKTFDGTGVHVAIIGTGPIDSYSGGTGDRDLDAFQALYNNLTVAHVTQVNVTTSGVTAGLGKSQIPTTAPSASPAPNAFPYSGDFQTPPPVTRGCSGSLPSCNPEDGEAQLDVQQAASLAPGASIDFYLAYNASDCSTTTFPNPCAAGTGTPQIGINEADPEIQQVIANDTADIISMSYGGGEPQTFTSYSEYQSSYYRYEFAEVAAEGIAAFASSGDSGSAECFSGNAYLSQQCVSYPSGDPNVTSVGGVTAYINSLGQIAAPVLAWGISTGDTGYGTGDGTTTSFGATGGGTSVFFPAPAAQAAALGNTLREQPDVSLIGDPATGVSYYTNARFGGGPAIVGGTSVSAPEMAATWALVLSACKAHPGSGFCPSSSPTRLGNAAPYLYAILKHTSYQGHSPSLPYASTFYDVLYGSNEMASNGGLPSAPVPGATARTGFDEVTGVGVPYAGHLIQAMTGIAVP